MSGRILDGRAVASRLWRDMSDRIADLHERTGATPRLAIIRFDARGPSAVYANSVWRAARSVGVEAIEIDPPEGVALSDLEARIGALNRDPSVAGIVVAQPVPAHLDVNAVVSLIDPAKDVDGATPLNAGRIARGERTLRAGHCAGGDGDPAHLRDPDRRSPGGGHRAVGGCRSACGVTAVGADATVVICHRRTRNLARETRRAEILVVAAGTPGLVRAEMVNRSAVVIDCGINTTPAGIVGDVDFAPCGRWSPPSRRCPAGLGRSPP